MLAYPIANYYLVLANFRLRILLFFSIIKIWWATGRARSDLKIRNACDSARCTMQSRTADIRSRRFLVQTKCIVEFLINCWNDHWKSLMTYQGMSRIRVSHDIETKSRFQLWFLVWSWLKHWCHFRNFIWFLQIGK